MVTGSANSSCLGVSADKIIVAHVTQFFYISITAFPIRPLPNQLEPLCWKFSATPGGAFPDLNRVDGMLVGHARGSTVNLTEKSSNVIPASMSASHLEC